MLSKRNTLLASLLGIVAFFVFAFSRELGLCSSDSYSECALTLEGLAETLLPVFPVMIFSLVTYLLRMDVYTTWFKFVRWAIPLSLVLILIAPQYDSDWMFPMDKGTVAFAASAIFSVVSLVIILLKYFSTQNKV